MLRHTRNSRKVLNRTAAYARIFTISYPEQACLTLLRTAPKAVGIELGCLPGKHLEMELVMSL